MSFLHQIFRTVKKLSVDHEVKWTSKKCSESGASCDQVGICIVSSSQHLTSHKSEPKHRKTHNPSEENTTCSCIFTALRHMNLEQTLEDRLNICASFVGQAANMFDKGFLFHVGIL